MSALICAICDEVITDGDRCVVEPFGLAPPLIHCVRCWDQLEDVKADQLPRSEYFLRAGASSIPGDTPNG